MHKLFVSSLYQLKDWFPLRTLSFPLSLKFPSRGAWRAQSVEHVTLDLGDVSLSPNVGCRDNLKEKKASF